MQCKTCGYKVDRYGPDGSKGKWCSCACKSYSRLGKIYPISNYSKIRDESRTLSDLTEN